jgi:diamine N-acetyltransferase
MRCAVNIGATLASFNKSMVVLRPLLSSDEVNVCRWISSPFIMENSFLIKSNKSKRSAFTTIEYAKLYFKILLTDNRRKSFAITYDKQPIGTIGFKDITVAKDQAEIFIEIGEPSLRGQGLGKQAMKLLVSMAFTKEPFLKLLLNVLEFNAPAVKIYYNLGFTTKTKEIWHHDKYGLHWRVLTMELKKENYFINFDL